MSDPHDTPADFAALGARLGLLRDIPTPPGLEDRLLAAIPFAHPRKRHVGLIRWTIWLAGTAAACLLVGVFTWQAAQNEMSAPGPTACMEAPAARREYARAGDGRKSDSYFYRQTEGETRQDKAQRPLDPPTVPAGTPAGESLGVQLALRTAGKVPGSVEGTEGRERDNSFGRFANNALSVEGTMYDGCNAAGHYTGKEGVATNVKGGFANDQADKAVSTAGGGSDGKGGSPRGGDCAANAGVEADKLEHDRRYTDGDALPAPASRPGRRAGSDAAEVAKDVPLTPAGNGTDSGNWTAHGAAGGLTTPPPASRPVAAPGPAAPGPAAPATVANLRLEDRLAPFGDRRGAPASRPTQIGGDAGKHAIHSNQPLGKVTGRTDSIDSDRLKTVEPAPPTTPAAAPESLGRPGDLSLDLVAHWAGEGNPRDSVADNHAALGEGVSYAPDRHGRDAGAFLFNGRGFVTVPENGNLKANDAFTLSAWVKPRVHPGFAGMIAAKWDEQAPPYGEFAFGLYSNGLAYICAGSDSGAYLPEAVKARTPAPVNAWTHLAVTFDRGRFRLYVNGVPEADAATGLTHTRRGRYAHDDLIIGAQWHGRYAFDGAIGQVALWRRALGPEEVQALFQTDDLRSALRTGGAPRISRVTLADRVELDDGSVLMGALQNASYTLTGPLGELKIPAARVAGLARADKGRLWLVLADGQELLGAPPREPLRLKLTVGSTLAVPLPRLRQAGYRMPATPPPPPAAPLPVAILRDGQRLAFSDVKPALALRTDAGEVPLAPRFLRALEPAPALPGRHRAVFLNGSTLTGQLAPDTLTLSLQLGGQAALDRAQFQGLLSPSAPISPPAEAAKLTLRNGDKLFGTVEAARLTVALEFGPVAFPPACAKTLTFNQPAGAGVCVELWDGSRVTGPLAEPAVAFSVSDGGPALKIPAGLIASISRTMPLPPLDVIEKVEALIRQLASPTASDRDAASASLAAMGRGVLPILRRHEASPDPETAQRIQILLKDLGPDAPKP